MLEMLHCFLMIAHMDKRVGKIIMNERIFGTPQKRLLEGVGGMRVAAGIEVPHPLIEWFHLSNRGRSRGLKAQGK